MKIEKSEETIWRITPEGESLQDVLRAFVMATYELAECLECKFGMVHEDEPLTPEEADRHIRLPEGGFGTAVNIRPSPFADIPPTAIIKIGDSLIFDASDFPASGFSPEKLLARVHEVLSARFIPA